jgi:hypothetical protein
VDDIRDRIIEELFAIFRRVSWPGATEFYHWEVFEGSRKHSYIWGPLDEETLDVLRLARDELQLWAVWRAEKWEIISIDEWRQIADKKKFRDVVMATF